MKYIQVALWDAVNAKNNARTMLNLGSAICMRGDKIKTDEQLIKEAQPASDKKTKRLCDMGHSALQRLNMIQIVVQGASRRFLAQITRHQHDVHFMSSSFHFSDHSDSADFVFPVGLTRAAEKSRDAMITLERYEKQCSDAIRHYTDVVKVAGKDAAGYMLPNSTRVTLLISATPWEWKHMIAQRTCRRNSLEIQYVMLLCWDVLYKMDNDMFSPNSTGRDCRFACTEVDACRECEENKFMPLRTPEQILNTEFYDLYRPMPKEEN